MALINIASGSGHGLRLVKETTLGETPATPTMVEIAYTGCSLGMSRETLTSNGIRNDRQIPFARTGVDKVAGDISFEFCAREYDALLEAALCGTFTADVLKVGKEKHMFSIERAFEDIGKYGEFTGCAVNQLSMSIQPGALITGTFGVAGLASRYEDASIAASVTPSQDPSPLDSFTGSLKVDGTEIAVVTGLEFNLQNGVDPKYPLWTRSAKAVSWGKSNLSGSLSAFFTSDAALLDKFINDARVSLEFTLENDEYAYEFLIPNVTLTGADNPVQSEAEVTLNVPWQAARGSALGTNFQITRIQLP